MPPSWIQLKSSMKMLKITNQPLTRVQVATLLCFLCPPPPQLPLFLSQPHHVLLTGAKERCLQLRMQFVHQNLGQFLLLTVRSCYTKLCLKLEMIYAAGVWWRSHWLQTWNLKSLLLPQETLIRSLWSVWSRLKIIPTPLSLSGPSKICTYKCNTAVPHLVFR